MINHKKAFSTLEIILVLVMSGLIVTLGMGVMRNTQSNYRHLYYAAYDNLKHSAGELVAVSLTGKLPLVVRENGVDRVVPFCQSIADNYNITSETSPCSHVYDLSPSRTFSATTPTVANPSFVLSNGQRYYVGDGFKPVGAENYFNEPAIMVAVDLNGTGGPNIFDSRAYTGERTPDIVAFAILESGMVLPMSPMADRDDYLTADVQAFDQEKGMPIAEPALGMIYKRVPLRKALSVTNSFPPKGGSLGVQYNTDTTYSFKTAYTVDPKCTSTTTFCKIIINNPILGGVGMDL